MSVAPPRAPVTLSIIFLNVVVFGAMVLSGVSPLSPDGEALVTWGADYGPAIRSGEWWRLLTSAFVHFGVLHLTLNMWALRTAGPLVERLYGSATFAAIYLVSAATGSLASLLRGEDTVSAGASGAVFGVFGALVAFLFTHRGVIDPRALQSLRSSALTVIAFNLGAGFLIPVIDNRAHIGGLLGGALAGLAAGSFRARPGARSSVHPALRVLAAGAAMAGALAMVVPRSGGGDELRQAWAWLEPEAARLEALDADLIRRLQDGAPPQEVARLYEEQVVPGWDAVVKRLEELSPAAHAHDPEFIEQFKLTRDLMRSRMEVVRLEDLDADLVRRLKEGTPPQEVARLYEEQVVPGWDAVVKRLEAHSPTARAHDPEFFELLKLKRDIMRAKLEALRTNQPEAIDRFHALRKELEGRNEARDRKTRKDQPAAGISP